MQQTNQTIITKAPGKVLVAGGYGVLEENNFGLSLALKNYFYCICTQFQYNKPTNIKVSSPQLSQEWEYTWSQNQSMLIQKNKKQNTFVISAILWTLRYFQNMSKAGSIKLKVLFNRGFISDANALDPYSKFPMYNPNYTKTGLGSSACVIVSIVKCLVQIFMQKSIQTKKVNKLDLINVISQAANLFAQKKIGSNFDISTAIFGTHLYKNILPRSIFELINTVDNKDQQLFPKLINIDPEVKFIRNLPMKLHAFMIDVNKGADTRLMVKGFLNKLKQNSLEVQNQFFSKSKQITLQFYEAITNNQINKLRKINKQHRELLRKFSKISGIPIQPQDLTILIDRIMEVKDVCYGICPGSGGYDAIFILSANDSYLEISEKIGEQHEVRAVEIVFEDTDELQEFQRKQLFQYYNK